MKEKFLALAEEVKKAGIAEAIYNTSNAEELKAIWEKFLKENQELVAKIESWKEEYKETCLEAIFDADEEIQNPMEVVIIIYIIDDVETVSECELCECYDDLTVSLEKVGNDFTAVLAKFLDVNMIKEITAEAIFSEG